MTIRVDEVQSSVSAAPESSPGGGSRGGGGGGGDSGGGGGGGGGASPEKLEEARMALKAVAHEAARVSAWGFDD